jgi:hypothetical protein
MGDIISVDFAVLVEPVREFASPTNGATAIFVAEIHQ